jgi:ribosomal protein L24E
MVSEMIHSGRRCPGVVRSSLDSQAAGLVINVSNSLQVMLFISGKSRSMYFQRKKAASLAWTTTWRRAHKKDQSHEQTKRKRRNLGSKKPRAIAGITLEVCLPWNSLRLAEQGTMTVHVNLATIIAVPVVANRYKSSVSTTVTYYNRFCHLIITPHDITPPHHDSLRVCKNVDVAKDALHPVLPILLLFAII